MQCFYATHILTKVRTTIHTPKFRESSPCEILVVFRISNYRQTSDIVFTREKIISGDVTVDAGSILVHATGALRRGAPIGPTPGGRRGSGAERKGTERWSGTERSGRAGRERIAGRETLLQSRRLFGINQRVI